MSSQCSQLLTTARIFGDYEISPKEVRTAVNKNELAGLKKGRKLYVERGELERWIRKQAESWGARRVQ